MSELDNDIVKEFVVESKTLINQLLEMLEKAEGDFSQVQSLEEYGNLVDRIMGGAKSLALLVPEDHALTLISDYAALCKAVGYKAAQIKDNEGFYDICVAMLLDATETLNQLVDKMDIPASELKKSWSNTFLERLRWVSEQFSSEFRGSVDAGDAGKKMGQSEIDELMKKLGL